MLKDSKINIASGKPAKQFPYTFCDSVCHYAGLAVNNDIGSDVTRGQCSHTSDNITNRGAWWSVSFQGYYYITSIQIFRRADECCTERLKGFTVYGKPNNKIIYSNKDKLYEHTRINIQLNHSLTNDKFSGINISIPGRSNTDLDRGIAYLTLCEVQAFLGQVLYCHIGELKNGRVLFSNGSLVSDRVPIETTIHYICHQGFNLIGHGLNNCDRYGNWSTSTPTCKEIECGEIPVLPNGYVKPDGLFFNCVQYGCIHTYMCDTGYTSVNSNEIYTNCSETGKWTTPTGVCSAVECPALFNKLANYSIVNQLEKYTYGMQLNAKCHKGYRLSQGNLTRNCKDDGNWTGIEPVCTIAQCAYPNNVTGTNGKYLKQSTQDDADKIRSSPDSFPYGTVLNFECERGYILSNYNSEIRTCLEDGTWSNVDPTCIESNHKTSLNNSAVIGGSVGASVAVVVTLVAVVVSIVIRRKRQNSNTTASYIKSRRIKRDEQNMHGNTNVSFPNAFHSDPSGDTGYSSIDEVNQSRLEDDTIILREPSLELETKPPTHEDEYYNMTQFDKKSPTTIMLEELTELVLSEKNYALTLNTQFQNLPTGLVRKYDTALQLENAKKNRYKQIYAYDDNRVILNDDDHKTGNNYINASFIHTKLSGVCVGCGWGIGRNASVGDIHSMGTGFDSARAYVASQGPTKDTTDDFWRMIWQLKSDKIVMLTNLKEEGKMKCKQYWPENDSQRIGNLTITLKDTDVFCDFAIRTLEVEQANERRIIRQFHFTAWPDRGVPKFASALVNFRNKVRKTKSEENHPTVVHCSAGIGRTGTYIALDILTEQGKLLGYVDVAGIVASLRRQRVNMVQNLDQYVFLHSALTEALMLASSSIPAGQFPQVYRELLQVDPVKRKRNIQSTYDMLKHMSPVADENQYISAREVRNKKRNRYSNILPVSEFMPLLGGASKDGYINAVVLPSYKERNALILTQMPLKNTKSDFWALVKEHNIHTIVMMNTIAEAEKEEFYWPDVGESRTFSNVEIETDSVETIGNHNVVTMNMTDGDTERTIKQVQCLYWPLSQSLPRSAFDIIETIELAQTLQRDSGNYPLVVHCMNGVDKSGLFCVVSAVIERLKIEQDVAITQVIEQMRCCRDQLIPSVEQFQFCHEVVLTYIQQFNEYSNFSSM